MNKIQISALTLNFIIYIIMISPILYISLKKSIYTKKKKFIFNLIISTIIEIILSIILYNFSKQIFSIFSNTQGIINYAVYASKIIFISSSLYSLKILLPIYIYKNEKKSAILFISKIAVNLILIFIGYNFFNTKGILYSLPICDLIYYIIYLLIFLNIIR